MSALILPEHLQPVKPASYEFKMAPRKMLGSEVAISKLMAYLTTVPDPDEMLRRAGIQRYQLRQLEADDEVSQCVETRRDAVVATPWRIEPNQDRAGKLLTELLEPHMEDVLKGAMEARYYGYSVQEMIFAKTPKGIGIDRILLKPMEWFKIQTDGTLLFFPDDGSGGTDGVVCDPNKFLLTRCNATYRNPYGEALLSKLYFPVTWRREGWGMWLQFLETFGEPIVLGQMADYEAFVEAMKAQGVRSTIGFQSVSESDKITTINASTPGEFDRLESAIIRRIEKLILGQTLTSDSSKTGGSYALGAVHHRVLDSKRLSDLRLIRHTGQHLVDVLCEVNRLKPHRFIQVDDSGLETARAQRDAILTPVLAASGLKLTKGYFLDHYDYLEDSLEERQEPTPEAPERDPDESPEVTPEQAAQQPPVANRSVADS